MPNNTNNPHITSQWWCEHLGVTRALIKALADQERILAPIGTLPNGVRIWDRAEAEAWIASDDNVRQATPRRFAKRQRVRVQLEVQRTPARAPRQCPTA